MAIDHSSLRSRPGNERAWVRTIALVLASAIVGSACGGTADDTSAPSATTGDRVGVPSTSTTEPPTLSAGDLTDCPRTLTPTYAERRRTRTPQPIDTPDPLFPEPVGGHEQLTFPKWGATTDGDRNEVVPVDLSVEVRRPDGTVTLAVPGGFVYLPNGRPDFGDLDGDGRADHVVVLDFSYYLVGGRLTPGTHDPREVGVRIADVRSDGFGQIRPIGDQDGDGADDLAFGDALYSGQALMSPRPGRSVSLPRPFQTVDHLAGALQLTPSSSPVLVQQFGEISTDASPPDDPIALRLVDNVPVCLVTGNTGIDPTIAPQGSIVVGWMIEGHRVVEVTRGGRDLFVVYRWDLDS